MEGEETSSIEDDYIHLKDLRVRIDNGSNGGGESDVGGFCLCFWLLISGSTQAPVTIIHQTKPNDESGVPFLVLSEEKKLTLFPLIYLHKQSPDDSPPQTNSLSLSVNLDSSLEKWIHIGCEVTKNYMCLHINGTIAGEVDISLNEYNLDGVTLNGNDGGDGKIQGYIHNLQILSGPISITNHFAKDPPMQLILDSSSAPNEIEECDDGFRITLGDKASHVRNFSIEVILMDAHGSLVNMEIELIASLVYAGNNTSVEKPTDDAEAPLLTNCVGLESPSEDKPMKLMHGRASFKLEISQLSSKYENRPFQVHFRSVDAQRYPFIEAYSPAIQCISRNGTTVTSEGIVEKPATAAPIADGLHSLVAFEGSPEILDNYGGVNVQVTNHCESKCSQSPKHVKDARSKATCLEEFEHHGMIDDVASDSESSDAKDTTSKRTEEVRHLISDAMVFRYCLEGACERSMLLREIVFSVSEQDILDFAEQVSLYTGCSHHRYQIMMARQLVQEGISLWNAVSQNCHHALWMNCIPEIERKFRKISCACRGLSKQDTEVLQRIAGCGDVMNHENFDKMWCWLYPVALTLSKEHMNKMWESFSPRWIEGLLTKDEAEDALKGPKGLQKPGTFVLRFPTSRSWPHPDAGSLVVTYVGADCILHNKIVSFHDSINSRPLQDLILEEPELSQLARVTR